MFTQTESTACRNAAKRYWESLSDGRSRWIFSHWLTARSGCGLVILLVLTMQVCAGGTAETGDGLNAGIESFRDGCRSWDRGTLQKSVDTFDAIIRNQPRNAAAYYWKGAAQFHLLLHTDGNDAKTAARPRLADVVDTLEKAVDLDPSDGESHALLGVVIGMQIADNSLSAIWRGPSVQRHQKAALKHAPANPRAYYLLGASYMYAPGIVGGNDNALKFLLQAEKLYEKERKRERNALQPQWGFSHCLAFIGSIYEDRNEWADARRYYTKALAENAQNRMAQEGLKTCQTQSKSE